MAVDEDHSEAVPLERRERSPWELPTWVSARVLEQGRRNLATFGTHLGFKVGHFFFSIELMGLLVTRRSKENRVHLP